MRFGCIALLLALVACGTAETPYVVLRIEDPKGLGRTGTMLVVTDSSGNSTQLTPAATGFPMTLTLTSDLKGPQSVTVDLYASASKVAHGTASIDFGLVASKTVSLVLDAVCTDPSGCSTPQVECTTTPECNDGVYCNGQETCSGGHCVSGTPPCAASPYACVTRSCEESTDRCVSTVDNAVCNTTPTPMYCDVDSGCVPSQTCSDSSTCDDEIMCNGAETCQNQACVPGTPVADGYTSTTCSPVACSETYGVGTAVIADGTTCDYETKNDGACYAGQCMSTPPSCTNVVVPASLFGTGQQLGGTSHDTTITQLHFPDSDPSGYNPAWMVTSSNAGDRSKEIQPLGSSGEQQFTIYVKPNKRMGSIQVRSANGTRCHLTLDPATETTMFVSSATWATLILDDQLIGAAAEQTVRFTVDCESGSPMDLRVGDVCLLDRSL